MENNRARLFRYTLSNTPKQRYHSPPSLPQSAKKKLRYRIVKVPPTKNCTKKFNFRDLAASLKPKALSPKTPRFRIRRRKSTRPGSLEIEGRTMNTINPLDYTQMLMLKTETSFFPRRSSIDKRSKNVTAKIESPGLGRIDSSVISFIDTNRQYT